MRKEARGFIPSKLAIHKAETARVRRDFSKVESLANGLSRLETGDINDLVHLKRTSSNISLQRRFLGSMRIAFVGSTSFAEEQQTAKQAYAKLAEAAKLHSKFYANPDIRHLALTEDKTIDNANVHFLIEMYRDSANLCFVGAAITGNTRLIGAGVHLLDIAIAKVKSGEFNPKDKGILPLLQFEFIRAHRAGGYGEPIENQFAVYKEAFNIYLKAKNFERAATIASRMILDARNESQMEIVEKASEDLAKTGEIGQTILQNERKKIEDTENRKRKWESGRFALSRRYRDNVADNILQQGLLFETNP